MREHIEREPLRDEILNDPDYDNDTINHFLDGIDSQPSADVVEVVRGRWIKRQFADEPTAFGYRCSECHLTYDFDTNYCPNCGADMRGDKND